MTDLIAVGVDGGGFQLLDDWLDDGTLPTLAENRSEGRAAKLRTTYPPVTCPAWRCYSTGVNPGKHGVFWWEMIDRENNTFTLPTSADFVAPNIWDYLGQNGYTSAVINMPTTYPPEPLNGWMVSGGGGVDGNDYTYPRSLRREIDEQFDYEVFISGSSSTIGDHPERVEQVLDVIDLRFDVAEYLRDEYDPDFLHLTVFYTNIFHHYFWDDDVTKRVWQRVDERLGQLIEDENVLVMSDHGTNEIEYEFYINAWLEREGYLVTTSDVSDHLYRAGVTRHRMTRIVEQFGLKNMLKRVVPQSIVSRFPLDDGTVSGRGKAEKIDWEASTAMASGQGPIYVLEDSREERRAVAEELAEKIRALTTSDGRPVAREVLLDDEAYNGPFVEDGPDLVIDQGDHIYVSGALGTDELFDRPTTWMAENHRDGVLFAHGPDITPDADFEHRPHIYDLAPTILHWFGAPVASRMDGRVLESLFEAGTKPGERPVEYSDYDDVDQRGPAEPSDESQMRDRLKDLGYLSE